MSMATSRFEIDMHVGFGRGSTVREYWLTRCQGFSAMRADGNRLGRVKCIETRMDGTFLRLTGFRAQIVPLSAVETVWPAASLLVVSDESCDEAAENLARAERRPSWTDDTVPWWELVDAETPRAGEHPSPGSPRRGPRTPRFALHAPRMRTLAFSLTSGAEPLAKAFAARAAILVERARNLARIFGRKAIRANLATRQALHSGWMTAQSAVLAASRRFRAGVARLLCRIAAWVGGDAFALSVSRESQPVFDEPDTEESI